MLVVPPEEVTKATSKEFAAGAAILGTVLETTLVLLLKTVLALMPAVSLKTAHVPVCQAYVELFPDAVIVKLDSLLEVAVL